MIIIIAYRTSNILNLPIQQFYPVIMTRNTLLCLSLCVFVLAESDKQVSKVVKTAQGAVRGYKDPEHSLFAFQSIPYATAPTGHNRYKVSYLLEN